MNDKKYVKINDALLELGIPSNLSGFSYIIDSIKLLDESVNDKPQMTELYESVAKINCSTKSRVERTMRHAIEMCFDRSNNEILHKWFSNTLNPKTGKLANSEFVFTLFNQLKKDDW